MTAYEIIEGFTVFENIHPGFFTIFINEFGPFNLCPQNHRFPVLMARRQHSTSSCQNRISVFCLRPKQILCDPGDLCVKTTRLCASFRIFRAFRGLKKKRLAFAVQAKVTMDKPFPVLFGFHVLKQGIKLLLIAFALDVENVLVGQGIG